MAEIVDQLRLEIDQALRDIGRVEQALDTALAPVEIQIDVDQAQLQQMEDTLREVQRIADRAATETQSIALAAGRAEVNFEDLARAMGITEAEARDLTTELLQSQAASNRLEDSARDIARQLGLSENEANRLTTSLRQADRAAEAIDVTAVRVASRFTDLRTAATGIAAALAAVGAGQLFSVSLRGANAAIQSFAQLTDSVNAVNVVFEEGARSVLQFGESAAQSAGLSELAFNQAVVPIGGLLRNFGFDAREAADAAVILVQRGADLASVYGGTVQDALLAVGAALRGEADPLERYSASISAARVESFALAEGLARTKAEITPAITLQARYGLILSDTARVAGDYVNTADDLANAQRTAAGEVQNFVSEVGEQLAPALETILVLLPDVLEGLRQLVPGFANAADSAASFFESVGEGGGFRTEGSAIGAVLESLTGVPGLVAEAAAAFGGLGLDIVKLDGNFTNATGALVRGGALIERSFTRGIAVALANSLDKGTDSVDAFEEAITQVARRTGVLETFTRSFRDFAIAANLTESELRNVTQGLINNADTIGLTAEEVSFLTSILNQLNETLDTGGRANADYLRSVAGFPGAFETVTTTFTTFTSELEEIPAQMDSIAVRTRAASNALGQSLNPFTEAPESIALSAREFFKRVTDEINREAEFQAGVVELILRGHFDLARMIGDQGPEALEALTGFLGDDLLATATEAALQTGSTATSDAIGDALLQAIQDVPPGPSQEALIALINDGIIDSPQVERGIVVGFASQAGRGISSFRQALIDEANQMDTTALANAVEEVVGGALDFSDFAANRAADGAEASVDGFITGLEQTDIGARAQAVFDQINIFADFFDDGAESRSTYFDGLSTPQSGEVSRLRESITGRLDSAIQRDSPPKLFLDAGIESGEAFWSGFNQAELNLRVAAPAITGGIAPGTTAAGVAGAVNVNINLDHASLQDPVSDVARMGQIAGSVAQTFNSVRPQ